MRSALDQQPPPHEVIVQDGGSTDDTLAILAEVGRGVHVHVEPDSGQADALNRAVARATGDIVVWLNADDTLVPCAFAAVTDAFGAHPEAEFVFGDFEVIGTDGQVIRQYRSSAYDPDRVFVRGCYIFSGAIFYRRRLLDRIGPFDTRYAACMDLDYMLRLGGVEAIHVGRTVAQFRYGRHQKSARMRWTFLRESHEIRWRAADSIGRKALTLALGARDSVYLVTHDLRHSAAWSRLRRSRRL